MDAVIGQSAVLLGLLASAGGVLTLAVGLRKHDRRMARSGRAYVWLLVAAAAVAVAAMERALITHDFSLKYVADVGSRQTPLMFTISSLWGALAGRSCCGRWS